MSLATYRYRARLIRRVPTSGSLTVGVGPTLDLGDPTPSTDFLVPFQRC